MQYIATTPSPFSDSLAFCVRLDKPWCTWSGDVFGGRSAALCRIMVVLLFLSATLHETCVRVCVRVTLALTCAGGIARRPVVNVCVIPEGLQHPHVF